MAPELAAFSGLYKYTSDCAFLCSRGQYVEDGQGSTARFGYCEELKAWAFSYGDTSMDVPDVCNWKTMSKFVDHLSAESHDIESTLDGNWYTQNARDAVVPLTSFELKCFDCESEPDFCGGDHGKCVVSSFLQRVNLTKAVSFTSVWLLFSF